MRGLVFGELESAQPQPRWTHVRALARWIEPARACYCACACCCSSIARPLALARCSPFRLDSDSEIRLQLDPRTSLVARQEAGPKGQQGAWSSTISNNSPRPTISSSSSNCRRLRREEEDSHLLSWQRCRLKQHHHHSSSNSSSNSRCSSRCSSSRSRSPTRTTSSSTPRVTPQLASPPLVSSRPEIRSRGTCLPTSTAP